MFVKQIILDNFQLHKHLEISFSEGVNVIYGRTAAGKSAIRKALDSVFFNNWKKSYRKTGTKSTSIKVILENDIVVERVRSATVNAYILYVGSEVKRFDAIGKEIPLEVLNALKTTTLDIDGDKLNLNIANQIALPFLLDKPATFRSKLFNKLTGSDIVDKALQDLNKDILNINREEKSEKINLEEKFTSLAELTIKKKTSEKLYNNIEEIFTNLKTKTVQYELLKKYLDKLDTLRNDVKIINTELSNIKIISSDTINKLNDKINKVNKLKQTP